MKWLIWLLSIIYYFYAILLQVSPSIMVHPLMHDFSVNASMIGSMIGLYFYAYAFMQMASGLFLDRFGTKKTLTGASFITAVGCLLFSFSPYFSELEFARVLIGMGSAFAAVSAMQIAAHWFAPKRFPFLVGLIICAGMLGAVFGLSPLSFIVHRIGWRQTLLWFAMIGFLITILNAIIVHDPKKLASKKIKQAFFKGFVFSIRHRPILLSSIYMGLMYAPIIVFGTIWGVPFLMAKYHFHNETAAFLVSNLYLGFMIGSPIIGWTYEKFQRAYLHLFLGNGLALLVLAIIIYFPALSEMTLMVLFFLFGLTISVFILGFTFVRQHTPAQFSGSALGFSNMTDMLVGAAGAPLIGWILDLFWHGTTLHGVRLYSITGYTIGLSFLLLLMLIGILLIPFLGIKQ